VKSPEEIKQLQQWVEESAGGKVKFTQLWKGSQDGFGAATFHSKCNNKGPTLTVIKSNNDKIFGGYTSLSWDGTRGYAQDTTAFIYSLTNKAKCATQKNGSSIWDAYNCGPVFGGGVISAYMIIAMLAATIIATLVLMHCLRVPTTLSLLDLTTSP